MEKWKMFRNYMHNELGITKDDIKSWIEDAVKDEAKRMIDSTYDNFSPKKVVEQVLIDKKIWFEDQIENSIKSEVVNQLLKHIQLELLPPNQKEE